MFMDEYLDWFHHRGPAKREFDLNAMGIGQNQITGGLTLWIRYVRAGDGERCTQGVRFDAGVYQKIKRSNPKPEVYMDLPQPCLQNWVTREEFISCMMQSPLLGETLRRLGATDHVFEKKKPIALDVTILD